MIDEQMNRKLIEWAANTTAPHMVFYDEHSDMYYCLACEAMAPTRAELDEAHAPTACTSGRRASSRRGTARNGRPARWR
jgi:hypothetical protein